MGGKPYARSKGYALAWLRNAASPAGTVPGGIGALATAMGWTYRHTLRVLSVLDEDGEVMRYTEAGRTVVVVTTPDVRTGCVGCGGESVGRYCPVCRQAHRRDLAWRQQAVEQVARNLAIHGEVRPASIAVAIRQPLFPARRDDDDDDGQAVVPYLLSLGLLGDGWRRALIEVVGSARADGMLARLRATARRRKDCDDDEGKPSPRTASGREIPARGKRQPRREDQVPRRRQGGVYSDDAEGGGVTRTHP